MNNKYRQIILLSAASFAFFLLQFIFPKFVDVWIIVAVLIALYVTSVWEQYFAYVISTMFIWTIGFLILNQVTIADKGSIFLICYYFLFTIFRLLHIDLDDSLPIKLVRPVFLYRNWIDVYRLILKKYELKEFCYQLRNGVRIFSRANPRDFIILDETWGANLYLKNEITISPGDIVVDIGAYIGDFTVYASQKTGPRGRVVAYEPFKETYSYLRKNISENKCKNVSLINRAVGKQDGVSSLFIPKNAEFGSSLLDITEYGECEEIKIRMSTIDSVFQQNAIDHIDLLKMDCEGGEYEILLSSGKWLNRIKTISLEYHQMKGHSLIELTDLLKKYNFRVWITPKNKYTGYIYAKRKK